MNRLFAAALLGSVITAHADSITVNVPLAVKSMRSEISHVRVSCQLWYFDPSGTQKQKSAMSPYMPLDSFGNLSRDMRLVINTSGVNAEQVHSPDSVLQCSARLYNEATESGLLITHGYTSPKINLSSMLNAEQTTLLIAKRNWVPDAPPRFELLNQNESSSAELLSPRASSLRIR